MTRATINRQILLASRPQGAPSLNTFTLRESSIPKPKAGDVLIKSLFLSVDPYMRGRLGGRPSSHPPFELQGCIASDILGRVVESKSARFAVGDIVRGRLDWAEYLIATDSQLEKIDSTRTPLQLALGILGMTGLTAYFGILEIGQPKPGETVLVSSAAGAVGMVVGQIAKIKGCRVVGIVGSDEKKDFIVNELGFDAAINYKNEPLNAALSKTCPNGIDIYFDNVGGTITDTVFGFINKFARIVLCGQISTYNQEISELGPRHFRTLIVKSARAIGYIVYDYQEHFPAATQQLYQWVQEGKIKNKESILFGIENAPKAFLGLFTGENIGKQLVCVQ